MLVYINSVYVNSYMNSYINSCTNLQVKNPCMLFCPKGQA